MLDVLEEQGQRITDPHCIATHTTEFFHDWHKAKDISYGFHKPDADIARLLNDKAYFHAETKPLEFLHTSSTKYGTLSTHPRTHYGLMRRKLKPSTPSWTNHPR